MPAMDLHTRKSFVMQAVARDGLGLQYAHEDLCNDKEVALSAIGNTSLAIQYVGASLLRDRDIAMATLTGDAADMEDFSLFHATLRADRAIVLAAAKVCDNTLSTAAPCFRSDIEVVRAALAHRGQQFRHVVKGLKEDPEIQELACRSDGMALRHMAGLEVGKPVVLAAVARNGDALRVASKEMRGDVDVVTMAVSYHNPLGRCSPLRWASLALRSDRAIVLRAVSSCGNALEAACKDLLTDREIVRTALAVNPEALRFLPTPLPHLSVWNDRSFLLAAVRTNGMVLSLASPEQRRAKDLVMAAVAECPSALEHAAPELRDDPDVARMAVQHRMGMRYVSLLSEACAANRDVAIEAVGHWGCALEWVAPELHSDLGVVTRAIRKDPRSIIFASAAMRDTREVVLLAVRQMGQLLAHASPRLKNDREVVFAAVTTTGSALCFANVRFRGDLELTLAALPTMSVCGCYAVEPPPDTLGRMLVELAVDAPGNVAVMEAAVTRMMDAMSEAASVAARYTSPQCAEVLGQLVGVLHDPRGLVRKRDYSAFAKESVAQAPL